MLKKEATLEGSKTSSCPVGKYKAYRNIGQIAHTMEAYLLAVLP